ncbi:hydrolase [Aliarcobacter butzleri]|uniref:Isochorismatase hydrolase n=2 Tax=Aliarcobacter butzleri TaxID=28197 RepID=A8ERI2_ALIB4|nr:hydrolase [Aliarcobacter butzleri]ABV66556.1 isochorismatase hydrolase [Aliarcobacter butzleri RM4018]KLD99567.1 isochorismatase hydrolase [Aliarcobacter butzleri L351]KLE12488.1 isochorismatase hydrolase [Aliarcobacter butzleri L350]MCG3659725.1 hydrolase [Aliarcobacter butzleri]MCG3678209.1 hydrolase [Aliarcobacter butzleri]
MRIRVEDALFCLVDVQERLFPHIGNKEILEKNLLTLVKGLKVLNVPFIVNEQYKKGIGETIPSLKELVETYSSYEKTTFSCCQNDETMKAIKNANKKVVIVAGIETHVCVLQTCIDLLENGFKVVLVTDCCSSRKENDTKFAIKRLIQAGVIPTTYESILFELTLDAKNPCFKEISSLVK